MKKPSRRSVLVNAFGTLGYLSMAMQWMWAFIVIAYPMLANPDVLRSSAGAPVRDDVTWSLDLPPTAALIITSIITLVMLILTIVIIVLLPKKVASDAARVTKIATTQITPLIANAPTSKKRRYEFSARVMLGIKVGIWLVPLLGVYFAPQNIPLEYAVVSAMTLFAAAATGAFFALQYGLAALLKVPLSRLR